METVTRKAYAKINLVLDVCGRRADGYHDLRTIMQRIDLCDRLTFSKNEDGAVRIKSTDQNLPVNEDNLIVRAAELFRAEASVTEGIDIELFKEIPVSAGLGGGSADAACTLLACNDLFSAGLSMDTLYTLAAQTGSDVPFLLRGGTQLAEGRGEILTPLPAPPACTILIAALPFAVSTADIYGALSLSEETLHPDVDSVISAIRTPDLHAMCAHMDNMLERVTRKRVPVIEEIENIMTDYGAVKAMMSGSGPTVFGIFDDEHDAVKAYHVLKMKGSTSALFVSRMIQA